MVRVWGPEAEQWPDEDWTTAEIPHEARSRKLEGGEWALLHSNTRYLPCRLLCRRAVLRPIPAWVPSITPAPSVRT